ncbi:MAG: hypothetical protein U0360_02720 [Dehalococcoidia bacterium]
MSPPLPRAIGPAPLSCRRFGRPSLSLTIEAVTPMAAPLIIPITPLSEGRSTPAVSVPVFTLPASTRFIASRKLPLVFESVIVAGPFVVRVRVRRWVPGSNDAVTPAEEALIREITCDSESRLES